MFYSSCFRCELNCSFAIDFTASNGDPNVPSSLHYMNPYSLNSYQTALISVGNIIKDYDTLVFTLLSCQAQHH